MRHGLHVAEQRTGAGTVGATAVGAVAHIVQRAEGLLPETLREEIAAVVRKGLMNGKPSGHFDPEGKLTRAQMAKILTQAYDLPRGTKPVPQLKDIDASFWAYEQINQLLANEVTIVSDFYYRPNDYVTRTQFAVFLSRAHNK